MMSRSWWILCLCVLSLAAHAHEVGVSRGEYQTMDSGLAVQLVFAGTELVASSPELDPDADGRLSETERASLQPVLEAEVNQGVQLWRGGQPCPVRLLDSALIEADGVRLQLAFSCTVPGEYRLQLPWLKRLRAGHRHLAHHTGDPPGQLQILHEHADRMYWQPGAQASGSASVWPGMLGQGLHHILTGYDHLVFLLALVLIGGRWLDLLKTITAFTLAHSLTLGLVALGLYTPDPRWVEPAIALSIAWLGFENLRHGRLRAARLASQRWRSSATFGLIHGFGFAGVLAEIGLPDGQVVSALLAFNLGVELGQLLVLLPLLPMLWWLRRRPGFGTRGIASLNVGVVIAGMSWLVLRVI